MSNYEQILEDDHHGHDSNDHWNYVRLFQKSERRHPARDYEDEPLSDYERWERERYGSPTNDGAEATVRASEFDWDWEEVGNV